MYSVGESPHFRFHSRVLQQFTMTMKGLRYDHIVFDLAWPPQKGTRAPEMQSDALYRHTAELATGGVFSNVRLRRPHTRRHFC